MNKHFKGRKDQGLSPASSQGNPMVEHTLLAVFLSVVALFCSAVFHDHVSSLLSRISDTLSQLSSFTR
ncbi:hypothetical protein HQ585_09530 [candidate division KSB1 bacterium]|nr:hypothetical protein [candidate division KSB1 bacterium]